MTNAPELDAPMTAEELYALPDDGKKYELVNGCLRVSEPPGMRHGHLQLRLGARLEGFASSHALGTVFVESGVILRRGPDTVRGPDVAYVARERLTAGVPSAYFDGAPDLAVEVLSPGDAAWELAEKVEGYLAAGSQLVWVVDPKNAIVVVHTTDRIARMLRKGDTLDGGDVLPGFTLAIADLFAEP